MRLDAFDTDARARGLCLRGALHPKAGDIDGAFGTVLLFGPDEPGFWALFQASPEASDGAPDPLDRWSKRVIGTLAAAWGGRAIFPSDRPFAPFLRWAVDSGRSFVAPVGLLVHADAGLLVSYRGAVAIPERLDLPAPATAPCETCETQPCRSACPVGALGAGQDYDVPTCRAHVASDAGAECRHGGCLVRRACPVSARLRRPAAQAGFHMAAFLGTARP